MMLIRFMSPTLGALNKPSTKATAKAKRKETEKILTDRIITLVSLITIPMAIANIGESKGVTSMPPITKITLSAKSPKATIRVERITKK